jgi:hypothetical protein
MKITEKIIIINLIHHIVNECNHPFQQHDKIKRTQECLHYNGYT